MNLETVLRGKKHKYLLRWLIGITLFLVVMHLTVNFWVTVMRNSALLEIGDFTFDFGWWFHLDREKKFGSIFNTLLILMVVTLMVLAGMRAWPRKGMALGWVMMAFVLTYMAIDEFFSIHEYAGKFAGINEPMGTQVVPDWVQVMAVVVFILMVPMGLFWRNLPTWLRIRTAIAAGVYLSGTIGGEVISSTYVMYNGFDSYGYNCCSAIEEGVEMLGMILCIDAMLLHFARLHAERSENQAPPIEPAGSTAKAIDTNA